MHKNDTNKELSKVWTRVDVWLPLPSGMRVLSNRGGQRPLLKRNVEIVIFPYISLYFPPSFWSPWSEEAMGWLNSVMLLSSIGDCASRMMAEWLLSCWCMISMLSFLPQDVKKCLMKCGVEDKVQVFLFCCLATILSSTFFHFLVQQNMKQFESFCHALGDTQIVKEDFVEAINNVLNSLQPSMSLEQCMAAWRKLICFWGIASSFWLQAAMCLTCMQMRFWDTSHNVFVRTSMEDS